jgi:SAM-dependent methyltransferase
MNPSYSELITAENYNRMMTKEHLYIAQSDRVICHLLKKFRSEVSEVRQVLEIGSGPMRITRQILDSLRDGNKPFELTILDHDPKFVEYSKQVIESQQLPITIFESDITTFEPNSKIDIAISQGFHHHIDPEYLLNLRKILSQNGIYIIGDEFIAPYNDVGERKINALIWYSHIIANAQHRGYYQLAWEEAKTFLDDISANKLINPKNEDLIRYIITKSCEIQESAKGEPIAKNVLDEIAGSNIQTNEPIMNLSRGDNKISKEVFVAQAQDSGFGHKLIKSIEPI